MPEENPEVDRQREIDRETDRRQAHTHTNTRTDKIRQDMPHLAAFFGSQSTPPPIASMTGADQVDMAEVPTVPSVTRTAPSGTSFRTVWDAMVWPEIKSAYEDLKNRVPTSIKRRVEKKKGKNTQEER